MTKTMEAPLGRYMSLDELREAVEPFKRTHCMCEGDEAFMTWLVKAGYMKPKRCESLDEFLERVWNETREFRERYEDEYIFRACGYTRR